MFEQFEKFVVLFFGALAAVYAAVLVNALCGDPQAIKCNANIIVLAFVALGALAFIVHNSRGHWGTVFGALLLIFTAMRLSNSAGTGHNQVRADDNTPRISAAFR